MSNICEKCVKRLGKKLRGHTIKYPYVDSKDCVFCNNKYYDWGD